MTEVKFFVAILGASQYTYVKATPSQKKEDFVVSVENTMRFFEGVPAAIVPGNLKSAVVKSSRFEPTIRNLPTITIKHIRQKTQLITILFGIFSRCDSMTEICKVAGNGRKAELSGA
jgi:hypothetical protein